MMVNSDISSNANFEKGIIPPESLENNFLISNINEFGRQFQVDEQSNILDLGNETGMENNKNILQGKKRKYTPRLRKREKF